MQAPDPQLTGCTSLGTFSSPLTNLSCISCTLEIQQHLHLMGRLRETDGRTFPKPRGRCLAYSKKLTF